MWELPVEACTRASGESTGLRMGWGSRWLGRDFSSYEMVPKEGKEREMGHGPGMETQGDTEDTEGGDTEKSAGR